MKPLHLVMVVAGSLAAGLPELSHVFPPTAGPYLIGAGSVCALLATILGAVSGSMLKDVSPEAAK